MIFRIHIHIDICYIEFYGVDHHFVSQNYPLFLL